MCSDFLENLLVVLDSFNIIFEVLFLETFVVEVSSVFSFDSEPYSLDSEKTYNDRIPNQRNFFKTRQPSVVIPTSSLEH